MTMGWMRPTANGVPFLGCRSWMWVVVCAKWWFVPNGGLRKDINLCFKEEDGCWFVGLVGMRGMVGFD